MAASVKSGAVQQELRDFPDRVKTALRWYLRDVATHGEGRARSDLQAKTVQRTGAAAGSVHASVRVGKTKASVEIAFLQTADFYAAWVNYGLAPRPWHERATTRSGHFISTRIGRGRNGGKPWGIRGRNFAALTQEAVGAEFQAAVEQAIGDQVESLNASRGDGGRREGGW